MREALAQPAQRPRVEAATLVPRVVAFAKEHRVEATIFATIEAVFSGHVIREGVLATQVNCCVLTVMQGR